ncbi:hypothetical protein HDU67_005233 [Dinochytrium kinnereticum]|nr:hypothetical protein HDU67_005233 [Dinochytrium kinnereticum]
MEFGTPVWDEPQFGDVREWDSKKVVEWMYGSGLNEEVVALFDAYAIDGKQIIDMNELRLIQMGITSQGARNYVLLALNELKRFNNVL